MQMIPTKIFDKWFGQEDIPVDFKVSKDIYIYIYWKHNEELFDVYSELYNIFKDNNQDMWDQVSIDRVKNKKKHNILYKRKVENKMNKKYILIGVFLISLVLVFLLKYEKNEYSDGQNREFNGENLDENITKGVVGTAKTFTVNEIPQVEQIQINILGEDILKIDKTRLEDNDNGDLRLDNRWEVEEIDTIFDTIRGDWEIKEYAGFIPIGFYNFNLYTREDRRLMGFEEEEKAFKDYFNKVELAKQNIPEFWISTNPEDFKKDGKTSVINEIYTNGRNQSPTSVVLCNSIEDEYPKFRGQTAVSEDFDVKYPVVYINFFVIEIDNIDIYDIEKNKYTPATLVFPSDDTAYILIGGAFYTIERRE